MKRLCASAALVLSLVVFSGPPARAAKEGDRAIDFTLKDLSGKTVRLSALKGKVVLLDFWASWCAPCKQELPALDRLAKKFKDEGKDVVVLTVNIDKDRKNAQKFLGAEKIKHVRVALNPDGSVASQYDLPTMPTSFVIDRRGIVRYVHAGYEKGDESKLRKRIEALLK